ncbi:hypothetical protein SEVIR_3G205950v4 [Setaria viridis]|uniref:Uncharacterized protein n=1 Tax=Setaria viridis TaxID=4556 RepID=A0A4U6VH16_SETVI|nr:hypothetical protein SEVIR_3G205950v2 [Setaria viridis]
MEVDITLYASKNTSHYRMVHQSLSPTVHFALIFVRALPRSGSSLTGSCSSVPIQAVLFCLPLLPPTPPPRPPPPPPPPPPLPRSHLLLPRSARRHLRSAAARRHLLLRRSCCPCSYPHPPTCCPLLPRLLLFPPSLPPLTQGPGILLLGPKRSSQVCTFPICSDLDHSIDGFEIVVRRWLELLAVQV